MRKDWTNEENNKLVKLYFLMKENEVEGKNYLKSEYIKVIQLYLDNRNEKSVQFKLRNISGVLKDLEKASLTVDGYSVAENYQGKLRDSVIEYLNTEKAEKLIKKIDTIHGDNSDNDSGHDILEFQVVKIFEMVNELHKKGFQGLRIVTQLHSINFFN